MLESSKDFKGNFTFADTQLPVEIEENIRQVHVYRDENYEIHIKAEGTISNTGALYKKSKKLLAGSIIKGGTIVCDTIYNGVITMHHCILEKYNIHNNFNPEQNASFDAIFKVFEIKWDWQTQLEDACTDTLIEWYLNGVKDTFLFCDNSSVVDNVSRVITRAGDKVHSLCNNQESYACDCVYIALNDTGVLIRKIPTKYGPDWSNNIALEYRSSYGRIPDKVEREKISELLSFLMGRHLILVGDTLYCKDVVMEANMYYPHSKNTIAECNSGTKEIVPVHGYIPKGDSNFRMLAQNLLPIYLEMRDVYDMGSVLERYWLANTMPLGVNLPILAGAMETLMKAWFKGKKSKTKGVYIDSVQYESIIKEHLEQIQDKLVDCEYKDNILRKISNCYQMGVNERYFIFLDELGLEYGEAEENSIRARNAFTHGDSGMDIEGTLQKTRTMFILFGRILLKLLSYEGEYIDETIPGFCRKKINDKIN